MTGLTVLQLQWKRHAGGYSIRAKTVTALHGTDVVDCVVPGGEDRPYSIEIDGPLKKPGNAEIVAHVLLGFANVRNESSALSFAKAFGVPSDIDTRLSTFLRMARSLDEGLEAKLLFDMDLGSDALESVVNRLSLRLRTTYEKGRVLETAPNFYSFCWHLLLRSVEERAPIRFCSACGDWYLGARRSGNRQGPQVPKLCGRSRCKEKWQNQGLREAHQAEIERMIRSHERGKRG